MNKNHDFERFCNALGILAEIHDKNLSKFAIAGYFETLRDYSIEDVEAAISRAIGTESWFPKPVRLVEIISGGSPQDLEDRAEIQAHEVLNTIRRVGSYQSVQFSDPITNAVISQGFEGWNKIGEMREADSKWFIRDFVRIYQTYARQGIKHGGHLPGVHEIQNSAKGFEVDPPILIKDGDTLKQLPN